MKSILKSDFQKLTEKKNALLKDLRQAEIAIGAAAEHGDFLRLIVIMM